MFCFVRVCVCVRPPLFSPCCRRLIIIPVRTDVGARPVVERRSRTVHENSSNRTGTRGCWLKEKIEGKKGRAGEAERERERKKPAEQVPVHGWDSFNALFRRGSYQHGRIDGRWKRGRAREAVVISAPRRCCCRSDVDFSLPTFVVIVVVIFIIISATITVIIPA